MLTQLPSIRCCCPRLIWAAPFTRKGLPLGFNVVRPPSTLPDLPISYLFLASDLFLFVGYPAPQPHPAPSHFAHVEL